MIIFLIKHYDWPILILKSLQKSSHSAASGGLFLCSSLKQRYALGPPELNVQEGTGVAAAVYVKTATRVLKKKLMFRKGKKSHISSHFSAFLAWDSREYLFCRLCVLAGGWWTTTLVKVPQLFFGTQGSSCHNLRVTEHGENSRDPCCKFLMYASLPLFSYSAWEKSNCSFILVFLSSFAVG